MKRRILRLLRQNPVTKTHGIKQRMSTILDLFIQDFVTTNKLLGQHWTWDALSSRRLMEAGPATKVFEFTSAGVQHLAVGRWLALPDGDWFRIELGHTSVAAAAAEGAEHRFDCLRLMHQHTHSALAVETDTAAPAVIVRIATRHRGLINLVFVVHVSEPVVNPVLV
jgi:hypothetical protein